MSKLHVGARQWVTFNPKDRQHRAWFAEYVRSRTWGRCPVRFEIDGEPGHFDAIQRLLLEYYSLKEFPVAEKPQRNRLTK